MKAYLKTSDTGTPKFRADRFKGMPGTAKAISRFDKLVTRNANRAHKKAARQESKLSIKKSIHGSTN